MPHGSTCRCKLCEQENVNGFSKAPADDEFINDLIHDLRDDIKRYEKRAAELEADALEKRRGAERCRKAIEYVLKSKNR
jgi:hypothetical protein